MAGDGGDCRRRLPRRVASPHKRAIGFWCFLASNVLWVAWGLHDRAWALVGLQFFLAALNIRGVYKNE